MIHIQNLRFSYGKGHELHIHDLTLRDRCFTVLVGENGSGKTTLLNLIMGTEAPANGKILLDGTDTNVIKRTDRAKKVAYFPQGRPIPDMSTLEVVTLGRFPYTQCGSALGKTDAEAIRHAMICADVSQFSERNVKSLSFGERQRVYLAMLLAQDAKNCLFDEPTNFMDVSTKFSLLDCLSDMRNEGKCILAVLHDLALAMKYADRLIVMRQGTITADGTPEELFANGKLEQTFHIRIKKHFENGETSYVILPPFPEI